MMRTIVVTGLIHDVRAFLSFRQMMMMMIGPCCVKTSVVPLCGVAGTISKLLICP
jgi:hypothetical protein